MCSQGLEENTEQHSSPSGSRSCRDPVIAEAGDPAAVLSGLGFQSIPGGALEPCMGGVVTLARDNVSCRESADPSQNRMYLCQDE